MKWKLAGVLAALAIEVYTVPADACGVKLILKAPTARRTVARSANPSHLLLLGTAPHRLERELVAAGHHVEIAVSAAGARSAGYAIVIVDGEHAEEARAKFGPVVIVRSGDVSADLALIEARVARQPTRVDAPRVAVARRGERQPLRTGPPSARSLISTKPPEAPQETERVQVPSVAVTVPAPPAEPATPPPASPSPARPSQVAATATRTAARDEVYFRIGSAAIAGQTQALDRTVRWLNGSADTRVVIEGYADPTGSHDANMTLSQRRAELVRDYLAAAGIDPARMDVMAYGDTILKYGRADPRNRRVAIRPR